MTHQEQLAEAREAAKAFAIRLEHIRKAADRQDRLARWHQGWINAGWVADHCKDALDAYPDYLRR